MTYYGSSSFLLSNSEYNLFKHVDRDLISGQAIYQQFEELEVPVNVGTALNELRKSGLVYGTPNFLVMERGTFAVVHPDIADFPMITIDSSFSGKIQVESFSHYSMLDLVKYHDNLFKDVTTLPVNGWRVFHYMDFASKRQISWSPELVIAIDEALTLGITPEVASLLACYEVPFDSFCDFLDLPYNWAAKIMGETASSNTEGSIYRMLEAVDEDDLLKSYGYPG